MASTDDKSAAAGRPGDNEETGAPQRIEYLLEDIDFFLHEIRSPLTAVIGYAELLRQQQLSEVKQQELLAIISKEAHHIDNLIRDFSDIYHGEGGSWLTEISFMPIDIGDLLRDTFSRFQNTSPVHSICIDLPAELSRVRGDADKLYLVLRNLLANAIKYSPDGGEVCVSASDCGSEVIIKIHDHGVGIAEEYLPNIFERGFRAQLPEGDRPRGSGLGLAMVKSIVERHNGRIFVESERGKGSLFIVALPKA